MGHMGKGPMGNVDTGGMGHMANEPHRGKGGTGGMGHIGNGVQWQ